MTFTIKEIEQQARIKLLDTYEDNYRFAPSEMFHAMRDGLRMIRNVRPESKYVDGLLQDKMIVTNDATPVKIDFMVPESFPASLTYSGSAHSYTLDQFRNLNINMEDRWMESLGYYVIHQMYLKDDADTANAGLADTYYKKFVESVKS